MEQLLNQFLLSVMFHRGKFLVHCYSSSMSMLCVNSSSCKLAMYADDLVLYKLIMSECEWFAFQQDITAISEWVDEHLLSLNISKCKCMILTCKSSRMPALFLSNKVIEQVSSYKYLGVHVTSDLKWNCHIKNICWKSRQLIGFMYRKFYKDAHATFLCRLYVSMVRPILEYACIVWDPHIQMNIEQLESCQKLALKMCSHSWNINYPTLLSLPSLGSLSTRIFEGYDS